MTKPRARPLLLATALSLCLNGLATNASFVARPAGRSARKSRSTGIRRMPPRTCNRSRLPDELGGEDRRDEQQPIAGDSPTRRARLRLVERGHPRCVAGAAQPRWRPAGPDKHHLLSRQPVDGVHLGPWTDPPGREPNLRRSARSRAGQQPRPECLLADHQPQSRSALGAQRRNLQRRPEPDGETRGAVRQRDGRQGSAGQSPAGVARLPQDEHDAEALRGEQHRVQPHHRNVQHGPADAARVLHEAVPRRDREKRPRVDHEFVQPRQRGAGLGQHPPDGHLGAQDIRVLRVLHLGLRLSL